MTQTHQGGDGGGARGTHRLTHVGVLLAAGHGRRMGRQKQLLPWPPNADDQGTVVSASFDAIAPWCEAMIVVVGANARDVIEALGDRAFEVVRSDPDSEMIDSIQRGIARAEKLDADVALLHPADHPRVARATMRKIFSEAKARGGRFVIIPEHKGRGGHPAYVPRAFFAGIRSHGKGGGVRRYFELLGEAGVVRLPVEDGDVVVDLDTPGDYRSFGGA